MPGLAADRPLWVTKVLAEHPATPPEVVDALVNLAASSHADLAGPLAGRPDLPDAAWAAISGRDPRALRTALCRPEVTADRAGELVLASRLFVDWLWPIPDPTGVYAAALVTRAGSGAFEHILTGPNPNPKALRDAAMHVARGRVVSPLQLRLLTQVWHANPDLRDTLLAGARTPSLRHRLERLATLGATAHEDHPTGSVPWLAHPRTTPADVVAVLSHTRSGSLWDQALTWAHDPEHTIAAWVVDAPFLEDRLLTRIALDTSRPMDLRRRALTAIATAHRDGNVPEEFEDLCTLLMPGAPADLVDTLAPLLPDPHLVTVTCRRPDTGPDRLELLASSPATGSAGPVLWALHPAASDDQRARATAWLEQVPEPAPWVHHRPGEPTTWRTFATECAATITAAGALTAGRAIPVRAQVPYACRGALEALLGTAVARFAPRCTPPVVRALVALEPTFTGTVTELFDSATAIAS